MDHTKSLNDIQEDVDAEFGLHVDQAENIKKIEEMNPPQELLNYLKIHPGAAAYFLQDPRRIANFRLLSKEEKQKIKEKNELFSKMVYETDKGDANLSEEPFHVFNAVDCNGENLSSKTLMSASWLPGISEEQKSGNAPVDLAPAVMHHLGLLRHAKPNGVYMVVVKNNVVTESYEITPKTTKWYNKLMFWKK